MTETPDDLPALSAEEVISPPALAGAGGLLVSVVGLLLAALKGGSYLSISQLNGWLIPFAIGLFTALFSIPFAANRALEAREPRRDERWEKSMLVWGAVAAVVFVIGIGLVLPGEFAPTDSLADAAGLLLVVESGMVLAALSAWLISG